MQQERSKLSGQATDEANLRLRQMSARKEVEMDITCSSILVSHANTPEGDLNLKEFIVELERGGIAVEAQSFYCG